MCYIDDGGSAKYMARACAFENRSNHVTMRECFPVKEGLDMLVVLGSFAFYKHDVVSNQDMGTHCCNFRMFSSNL